MCRTGGPYCYKGATKRLEKALEELKENPDSAEKRDNAAKMQLEYNGTRPRQKVLAQGIEDAQERGDLEAAERLKGIKEKAAAHRKQQLADSKKREAAKKAQKEETTKNSNDVSDRLSGSSERLSGISERLSGIQERLSASSEGLSGISEGLGASSERLSAISERLSASYDRLGAIANGDSTNESKALEVQRKKEIERDEDLENDTLPSSEMTPAEKKDLLQAISAREAELLEEDRQDYEYELVQEMNEWKDEHSVTRALPPLNGGDNYKPRMIFNTDVPEDGSMVPYKALDGVHRTYMGVTKDKHVVEVYFKGRTSLPSNGSVTASVTVFKKQNALSRFFGARNKSEENAESYSFKMKANDPGNFEDRRNKVTSFDMSEVSAGNLKDLHTALKAQSKAEEKLRHARGLERKVHINDPVRPVVEAERYNREEFYNLAADETSDVIYRINEEIQDHREKKLMEQLGEYDNYLKS